MAGVAPSRPRNLVLAAAILATIALGVAAVGRHPQGDVARVVPYAVAAIGVWSGTIAVLAGPRRGASVACVTVALGLVLVAGYVLVVRPIPYAECGTLAQEWRRPACRSRGALGTLSGAALGAPVLALAGRALWKRASRARAEDAPS